MKIYVDEMPENCYECSMCGKFKAPAQRPEIECPKCNLAKRFNTRSELCILNDLRIHDKKVRADERKKVCKKLRQKVENMYFAEDQDKGSIELAIIESRNEAVDEFLETLDKIEKGENNGSVGD